jgi:RNA polymerase sigma factor (sigma-70 family)
MADQDLLAREFEEHRTHLRSVAYRVLGSAGDAEDAVQEAWLRMSRSDVSDVVNMRGWLTTVTGRVALNMLDARKARREETVAALPDDERALGVLGERAANVARPEDEALLGDAVGAALQVVLDTLEPRERLAFVLHDMFAVPFDEIAPVVGASSVAARQMASRARRRVQAAPGDAAEAVESRQSRQRDIVTAFFAAAREARFGDLLELLDPDVVMRADERAAAMGANAEVSGADAVARFLSGGATAARFALVGGEPGAVWATDGKVRVAFAFTITEDQRIVQIDLIAIPEALATLDIALTPNP